MYKLLEEALPEEEDSRPIVAIADQGGHKIFGETLQDAAKYHLHKITAHTRLLPYTNMVR